MFERLEEEEALVDAPRGDIGGGEGGQGIGVGEDGVVCFIGRNTVNIITISRQGLK